MDMDVDASSDPIRLFPFPFSRFSVLFLHHIYFELSVYCQGYYEGEDQKGLGEGIIIINGSNGMFLILGSRDPAVKRKKGTRTRRTKTKTMTTATKKEIIGSFDQTFMEKKQRQVFLRSYQFSRKRSLVERIKRSVIRVRQRIWFRIGSVHKLPRLLWFKLRGCYGHGYYCCRYGKLSRTSGQRRRQRVGERWEGAIMEE